jgi:hypothetical protein
MSIFKINQTDFQTVTVATNPSRFYSSGSGGVTGSVHIFARRSSIEKDVRPSDTFSNPTFNDSDLSIKLDDIKHSLISSPSTDILGKIESYLGDVNEQSVSQRKQKTLDVGRYIPVPVSGGIEDAYPTKNYLKKTIIRENLSKHYRCAYPSIDWGYCNYHSLNFFSASGIPHDTALLYPNYDNGVIHEGYVSGTYTPSGSFSFDFYINPRYKALNGKGHFDAGTIFHLHKVYALSLITGSKKDENGLPVGFRLMLQLSHSAGISPSAAATGNFPNNLTFLSDDNSLSWNNWHHAVVRWGTDTINAGTGSFNIDGIDRGYFVVPSGTIAPKIYPSENNPDVLCIGNYLGSTGYLGLTNKGVTAHSLFFSKRTSDAKGTLVLTGSTSEYEPFSPSYTLNHPLQAEVHDLCIKRYYVADADIASSGSNGLKEIDDSIAFYLPPFFVEEAPVRRKDPGMWDSGVHFSLNRSSHGTNFTPFNLQMSFGSDAHLINIENFLKDFANGSFSNIINLNRTSNIIKNLTSKDANEHVYHFDVLRKRNLSILPCDDGNFYPDYALLNDESKKKFFVDDTGSPAPGYISLNALMSITSSIVEPNANEERKHLINDTLVTYKWLPEDPTSTQFLSFMPAYKYNEKLDALALASGTIDQFRDLHESAPLGSLIRTKDPSSNQVTMFDVSNLYYGLNILPGSFTLKDSSLSGSAGAISVTIKDDGHGTLYRSDSLTQNCSWNAVGTIFYNEGIIVIKNPHLYFFGKDGFEMSFKGEQNIHVLRFDVLAPSNHLNSSSNPSFAEVPSTLRPNEYDSKFVYVTGINFHDDNLNVIMKTQLAQPIMKRHSDKLAFKVKYDF